jgi:hypothetical protein
MRAHGVFAAVGIGHPRAYFGAQPFRTDGRVSAPFIALMRK